jgi:alcohol dehydrogenase class IV
MTAVELPNPGRSAAPVVAYGVGAIAEAPAIVGGLGARRVLLVCGRSSFEASGAAAILPELERAADVRRWSDFQPNTDSADLRVGLQVLRDFQPDLVLGVGGGSALDMAKLLVSFTEVPSNEVAGRSREVTRQPRDRTAGSGADHQRIRGRGHPLRRRLRR